VAPGDKLRKRYERRPVRVSSRWQFRLIDGAARGDERAVSSSVFLAPGAVNFVVYVPMAGGV